MTLVTSFLAGQGVAYSEDRVPVKGRKWSCNRKGKKMELQPCLDLP